MTARLDRTLVGVLVTLVLIGAACSDDTSGGSREADPAPTTVASAADSVAATTVEWPVTRCGT